MTVLLVHPTLTLGEDEAARQFLEACRDEIEQRDTQVEVLRTTGVLDRAVPRQEDAVVFFNHAPGKPYPPQLLSFLERAVTAGSEVVPIAMGRALRVPPPIVAHAQSWDIVEQLRQRQVRGGAADELSVDVEEQLRLRALPPQNLTTVALELSRTILSRLQPTLAKDRMHFFISHRRADGEQLAGALYDRLRQRNESAFRDLNDVAVGENAQQRIAEHLSRADAVIFLDTPLAATSEWVTRELCGALALNIPIIWIRLGEETPRTELPVKPGPAPHLSFPDRSAAESAPDMVDKILEMAFRLTWESASRVYGQIARLQALPKEYGFKLTPLEPRALIYAASFPRSQRRYPERRVSHVLQFYGRRPAGTDRERLQEHLRRLGFAPPHATHGPFCDATLMLSPFPSLPPAGSEAGECVVDSVDGYVESMSTYLQQHAKKHGAGKGLIISGAFPEDISPQSAQLLTSAVHAFVRATLEQGATVIFGAHPTFQPLIFELARQLRPDDFKQALHLYVSRLFVETEDELDALRQHATVFPVDAVGADRNRSLTRMRVAMISDPTAVGLVALGGKPPRPGIPAGVDEECELALGRTLPEGSTVPLRKLPVFCVGTPGGRAAVLAAEAKTGGWMGGWNSLSPEQNELLRCSPDFDILVDLVLRSVGIIQAGGP